MDIQNQKLESFFNESNTRTIESLISVLAYLMRIFISDGCTLLVKNIIISFRELSAHIIVPVYPVCPKESGEKSLPQGGNY